MRVSNQWLCAIALAFHLYETSGLSMEQMCSYWPGTGFIADAHSCQRWGYCRNNKLEGRGQCRDDLYYDFQSGACQQESLTRCAPLQWDLCTNKQAGEHVADPMDCRKYKKCDVKGGAEELNYCADGYMFSNRLQTCVSSGGGCPQDSIDICAYLPNGISVGAPLNCGLYLECHNGTGRLGACTAGRYYNYKTGHCQTTQPEHCEDDYEPVKNQPAATDAYVCAKFYQGDRSGDQFISDALTCHGYYKCSSQYAIGKWQSCPQGSHFQWWSQKCVNPKTYSCPFDRCANLNATFVTAINSGCTEYIYCINQISNKLLKCPKEYPYFDEKRGECIDRYPNYTVCFMND